MISTPQRSGVHKQDPPSSNVPTSDAKSQAPVRGAHALDCRPMLCNSPRIILSRILYLDGPARPYLADIRHERLNSSSLTLSM